MIDREKVYVQVYGSVANQRPRWKNYEAFETYEEAVEQMKKWQTEYPEAQFRILDNNKVTHTK